MNSFLGNVMRGLKNKSCIVTGAARGIGLATVERFLEEGVALIHAIDIDSPQKRLDSDRVIWQEMDVSNSEQITRFFKKLEKPIHILVNNAAVIDKVNIFSSDFELWENMIRNNLSSVWLMTHHFAINMKNRNGGAITNVGSVDAFYGHPERTGYAAAKAGVVGLTNTTAKQLSSYGIRVNCVVPGAVTTRMTLAHRSADYRPHRLISRNGEASEIASSIAFLSSDDASYITGQCLFVDGGAHRF